MKLNNNLITTEQVSCGHPDKLADLIADTILMKYMSQDPASRVAIEVLIKGFDIIVAGEVTSDAEVDYTEAAREALTRVGVDSVGIYEVKSYISFQSPDIAQGVDRGGAGDQGVMYGFACNDTPNFMPLGYDLATKALINLRAAKCIFIKPDAKAQVTLDVAKNKIDTFLISTQHDNRMRQQDLEIIVSNIMRMTARAYGLNTDFKIMVNPTGRFVIGGSHGDTGVTGRKIIADSYGGYCPHGGGAFSGKDPTKMDRSGAYMARYLAIQAVKRFKVSQAIVALSYAIGQKKPVSVRVTTPIGGPHDEQIAKYINRNYDLTPDGIINFLHLREIDYTELTCYGHFGKPGLPWECYKWDDHASR